MDRNTLLALLLCMLVFIVYTRWVMPRYQKPARKAPPSPSKQEVEKPPAEKPVPAPAVKAEKKEAPAPAGPQKPDVRPQPKKGPPRAPEEPPKAPEPPARKNIKLAAEDSPLVTFWTNRGAGLREAFLKDYFADVGHTTPLKLLDEIVPDMPSLLLIDPDGVFPLDTRTYDFEQADGRLLFRSAVSDDLTVEKHLELQGKLHHIKMDIAFLNKGHEAIKGRRYSILSAAGIVSEDPRATYVSGVIGYRDPEGRFKVTKTAARKLRKGDVTVEGEIAWGGTTNKYFAAILLPQGSPADWIFSARTNLLQAESSATQNAAVRLTTQPFSIEPGQRVVHSYLFFIGPKDTDVLQCKEYDQLVKVIDYGWFGGISRILLSILEMFYKIIPNYGVAIILLTVVVKIALHPLARKTQVSMHKMQRLQPLISELREKHKNDSRKLGQEQWALFRQHRVNPFGGCLPMIIQIPVFISLFRALQLSIRLRQAPFVGWIKDLSSPDTVATLPVSLPFIGRNFNILPILMTATWLIQQMTMPKPGDEQQRQQQKMMMFMPVMFGVMLYNMPSGLILYWFINTLLGIFEQFYIKKVIARMPDTIPAPAAQGKRKK